MSPNLKKFKEHIKLPHILLFIVAAIVPIIVRTAWVRIPPEFIPYYHTDINNDLFSFHAAWLITVCATFIILLGASDFIIKGTGMAEIKEKVAPFYKDPVIIISAVYIFFVILSNLLSPYTYTALWGIFDRREGLFVQLAYMTVFFATIHYVKKDLFIAKFLLFGLMLASLIMGGIGFSQFINRDFFGTQFAAFLVVGQWNLQQLQLLFAGDFPLMSPQFEMSYGTNFNPNTFGLVTAMLTPVLFASAVFWKNADKSDNPAKTAKADTFGMWSKVVCGLFIFAGILMAIGIVSSRSVGGLIGGATAIAVVLVTLLCKTLMQTSKTKSAEKKQLSRGGIITLATLFGAGAVLGIISSTVLRGFFHENLSFTMGRVAAIFEPPNTEHLADFNFEGTSLTMTQHGLTYTITFPTDPGPPTVTNVHGEAITPSVAHDPNAEPFQWQYTYELVGYGNVMLWRGGGTYLYRNIWMTVDGGQLILMYPRGEDGAFILIDPNEPIPSWGFEGWETWGSNRGYIFARTIPLLADSIFIGSGSDTFLIRFPTHDIISNYRYFHVPYMLVDKAHNLYLQTAITTGLVSALALIALFAHFIITTFWSLIKQQEEQGMFWLRLGILASVSAYSVSSLSTDSTVSSTPMFWIILGIGYALRKDCVDAGKSH